MGLTSGAKLGPYEIQSPLGTGGMGEVYRARDTRLDRTVAIKILPAHLSENFEAKQRFEREARAISSLNHPNICMLHDVGHQDGIDFLVMEYLEGKTLADHLAKGPLSLEQVLRCGIEICEGLERAHKIGLVHRDLKPGNVMLTKTGAKLLDFGLAKVVTTGNLPSSGLTATLMSPAGSHPLTAQGTVVGTFQYMSPEQVEGKEGDARGDIFALGTVLYEMVTGRRAFTGKSQASVVAAILASDPQPISAIQPMAPPALDRVVKTCLAKDPDERFQNIHDLKMQLKWIAEGGSQAGIPVPVAERRKTREQIAWIAAAVALLAALTLVFTHFREAASEARIVRSTILPPENGTFVFLGLTGTPVLSPDGRNVAFIARTGGVTQLWVRALDSFTPRALAGTEDAYQVFWSADNRNLGFFAPGKLKRVAVAGGPPLTLCDVDQARGGSWSQNDVIIFAKYPGEIYRVSASGGIPQQVTHLDPARHDITHRWPYFLPDGNHFFYMASAFGSASEDNVIYLGSLDGRVNRVLFHGSSTLSYGNGYLVYLADRTLIARPFDLAKLDFTAEPAPVAEGVQFDPIYSNGVFSVSQNGTMLYRTGSFTSARTMGLFDRNGKSVGSLGEPAPFFNPRVSPDGKRVAYTLIDATSGKADVWIQEIGSGNRTRLTVDPQRSSTPVWSNDGAKIACYSTRSGKAVIYVKPADGMGVEQKIFEPSLAARPNDWTLDSKTLIVQERSPATGKERLVLVTADGKGQPTVLIELTSANVAYGRLSPDGHWIAYQSDESGKSEVYVSGFPRAEGRLQVSLAGGRFAAWRRDGKELYYLAPDGNLMAVEVKQVKGSLQAAAHRPLFQTQATNFNDSYDPFPDEKKFLVDTVTTTETPAPLSLVLNWPAELKK
jgi:Tol biopolymer transport system component